DCNSWRRETSMKTTSPLIERNELVRRHDRLAERGPGEQPTSVGVPLLGPQRGFKTSNQRQRAVNFLLGRRPAVRLAMELADTPGIVEVALLEQRLRPVFAQLSHPVAVHEEKRLGGHRGG